MIKKTVIALYFVVVVVMAAATIVEKYQGTTYVADHIYGSWWFSALWALLTALAVFHFVRRRVRRPSAVALHLSFVVILAGALLTHLTSRKGIVHLRQDESVNYYFTEDYQQHPLPFNIRLDRFEVRYHPGTEAPSDYVSHISMDGQKAVISMNQIVSHDGFRLYQSSFDNDLQGSILALNSDPWGIPVTYFGYALLFVSLVWILVDPRGTYRQLLRRAAAAAVLAAAVIPMSAQPRVLPAETAARFGRLFVVYNDRVCPMQTYALDFTKKLCGRRSYQQYTAEQVLTGFVFFYQDWTREPVIKVKDSEMKQRLNLPDQASYSTFFNRNGYTLGPYLQHRDIARIDEKLMLIMDLHQGRPLKIFPYADSLRIAWYSPTSTLPANMDAEHQKYMREVFTLINGEIQAGRYDVVDRYLDKLLQYQQTFGRHSLPASRRVQAEFIYNKVAFATILFMVCLTLGFVLFGVAVWRPQWLRTPLPLLLLLCAFLVLTFCLALRWVITGVVPMSNGYETMLFLAWSVQLLAMLMSRRFPIMLTFGFLLSGFFLLVSHISQMDPQMTHLMPVLNSPLLTIHVSVIMMSFALLSLTFICALTALLFRQRSDEMQLLSLLMLYPALSCLGFGIFIGAVWANVSWGTYWSWDPKETWALIT
ncbi:MAG: cytochrome c biogenesis protein CcsA, partial [Prevotella sp.]|nr:cytochrome c biogenesis protein CcsA [Prevotella sp.]